MNKAILALLIGLMSLVAVGCGDDSTASVGNDFVANGTTNTPPTTGNLVFNFTRPQTGSVPVTTTQLVFNFYDAANNLIFSVPAAFNTQVTINNVPAAAVRVEILASNAAGYPLASLANAVTVIVGSTATVNLSAATSQTITFDAVVVSPSPVVITNQGTQQLVIQLRFSNGTLATLNATDAEFSGLNAAVATISPSGLVTGVAAGTSTLTVSETVGTQTRSVNVSVQVQTFVITPNPINVKIGTTKQMPASALFTNASGALQNVTLGTTFGISPAVTGITSGGSNGRNITVAGSVSANTSATYVGTWPFNGQTFTASTTVTAIP